MPLITACPTSSLQPAAICGRSNDWRPRRLACWVLSLLFLLTACSPELNWRQVQNPGEPLRALFPCKPQRFERAVPHGLPPASAPSGPHAQAKPAEPKMFLMHCTAGTIQYAITSMPGTSSHGSAGRGRAVDQMRPAEALLPKPPDDPQPQLHLLKASAAATLSQAQLQRRSWSRPGGGASAELWEFKLVREGRPLQGRAVFFTLGGWAYQAMVLGEGLHPDAVEPFLEGLELSR
jgi:hypothetical protein